MAVSDDQIAALEEALASGERVVQHGDKRTEYRSVSELSSALDRLKAQKSSEDAAAGIAARPIRQVRHYHGGRGY